MIKKRYFWIFTFLIVSYLAFYGCNGIKSASQLFQSTTPFEKYRQNLLNSNLTESLLFKKWYKAGQSALNDSLNIEVPYQETGIFKAEQPKALAYLLKGREGANLVVTFDYLTQDTFRVFIDLYKRNGDDLKHLLSAKTDTNAIKYAIENEEEYILRIQPELLAQGYYHLKIYTEPLLAFPVQGVDHKAIGSVWGDPRDGGRRKHEGIDIFAPKGTPALAASDGMVTRVQTTRLGGKVVWLRDKLTRQNLYYAHLDSQLVKPGQQVKVGDVIGLIGNSGNARYTPPHLHFGIYQYGAKNPYPFVYQKRLEPVVVDYANEPIEKWQITRSNANFRRGPSLNNDIIKMLTANLPIKIIGISNKWMKIQLPDRTKGFVHESLIKPTSILKKIQGKEDQLFYEWPSESSSPVAIISSEEDFVVLGKVDDFYLTPLGWTK